MRPAAAAASSSHLVSLSGGSSVDGLCGEGGTKLPVALFRWSVRETSIGGSRRIRQTLIASGQNGMATDPEDLAEADVCALSLTLTGFAEDALGSSE
ncbi:unnamed protein product [Gongylonema pulchrum]|uniref:Uncharacterized protein n=1 Tax=Gongylonema pulchrum TaxID=637853 RepID=A0A183EBJ4_9BILA|nr:unnamed protein product [Gongylonema pulchrum]